MKKFFLSRIFMFAMPVHNGRFFCNKIVLKKSTTWNFRCQILGFFITLWVIQFPTKLQFKWNSESKAIICIWRSSCQFVIEKGKIEDNSEGIANWKEVFDWIYSVKWWTFLNWKCYRWNLRSSLKTLMKAEKLIAKAPLITTHSTYLHSSILSSLMIST